MEQRNRRIRSLPDDVALSVRASQVIGSVSRAVEELIRNSIIHGCADNVVVTVGAKGGHAAYDENPMDEIQVSDNGLGIDANAMRNYIGTEYCSNSKITEGFQNKTLDRGGESLKSIAALCIEMKIETVQRHCDNDKQPTKISKILRDGCIVSFIEDASTIIPKINPTIYHACKNIPKNNGSISTGTTITLKGLFHRHAVRKKQRLLDNRKESTNLSQIRSSIQALALSYPCVKFLLKNGTTGKIYCNFTEEIASQAEPDALFGRLCTMYQNEFSAENSRKFSFKESDLMLNKKTKSDNDFRAFGVIRMADSRNRELEVVAINGRIATHGHKLADVIQTQISCNSDKSESTKTEVILKNLFQNVDKIPHFAASLCCCRQPREICSTNIC